MDDEVRPPSWAVGDAVRLSLTEFGEAFAECWRSSATGMDKVEAGMWSPWLG